MAIVLDGLRASFKGVTGTDYTGTLYKILQFTSAGVVDVATAATQNLIGVQMQKAKANMELDVLLRNGGGIAKIVAGGTIAINDKLTSNASGAAITTVTSGDQVIGTALEAAVTGQIVTVLLSTQKV